MDFPTCKVKGNLGDLEPNLMLSRFSAFEKKTLSNFQDGTISIKFALPILGHPE